MEIKHGRLKKSIRSFIKTWKSTQIESDTFKKEMYEFWSNENLICYQYITSVKVFKKKKKFVIKITSHMPTTLIGKNRKKLAMLTEHMNSKFGNVIIEVKKSKIWKFD